MSCAFYVYSQGCTDRAHHAGIQLWDDPTMGSHDVGTGSHNLGDTRWWLREVARMVAGVDSYHSGWW